MIRYAVLLLRGGGVLTFFCACVKISLIISMETKDARDYGNSRICVW